MRRMFSEEQIKKFAKITSREEIGKTYKGIFGSDEGYYLIDIDAYDANGREIITYTGFARLEIIESENEVSYSITLIGATPMFDSDWKVVGFVSNIWISLYVSKEDGSLIEFAISQDAYTPLDGVSAMPVITNIDFEYFNEERKQWIQVVEV